MMGFSVDKDMLPMKGHYFLFNAGTAPLVPYLPTYAKQLGFSTYTVGIIYTFLPIFGMIAKPLFGAIADRFKKHKFIFILFQLMTIFAFGSLYYVPKVDKTSKVSLSCGNGEAFFSKCSVNDTTLDECGADFMTSLNNSVKCQMSCDMSSTSMWQTVCEHWKIPQYCYTNKKFSFQAKLPKKSITTKGDCAYLQMSKSIMLDDKEYFPQCSEFRKPFETECSLYCSDNRIDKLLSSNNSMNLFCENNITQFKTCSHSMQLLQMISNSFKNEDGDVQCTVKCEMNSPNDWMDMCTNWKADDSLSCKPSETDLPMSLKFTSIVPLEKTLIEGSCIYFKIHQVNMDDGTKHFPICPKGEKNSHFQTKCIANCEYDELNNLLSSGEYNEEQWSVAFSKQLWIFFVLMALNWIGMAVVVSIADAICFEKLGERVEKYGQQRLWGSAGWGIFSLLAGFLIDEFSEDHGPKNYLIAFIMMLILLSLNVIVTMRLQYQQKKMSVNIFRKVGVLFTNKETCHFFIWIILVGMCTGLLWQFMFWYLEDLAKASGCEQTKWIKTLQGFVSGMQCFLGEIPFFFFSGHILKKIGHIHSMSLVLLGFGVRFILYSVLINPWWVLPIELLQGITFGMLYTTMASYASTISPEGTEATLQGLVGAIFEGVGTSLGSFVGGFLYLNKGGSYTFQMFGIAALLACLLNILLSRLFCKPSNTELQRIENDQEYSSIVRYAAPNDAIDMLSDHCDEHD